jgi:hypothetical protein
MVGSKWQNTAASLVKVRRRMTVRMKRGEKQKEEEEGTEIPKSPSRTGLGSSETFQEASPLKGSTTSHQHYHGCQSLNT